MPLGRSTNDPRVFTAGTVPAELGRYGAPDARGAAAAPTCERAEMFGIASP